MAMTGQPMHASGVMLTPSGDERVHNALRAGLTRLFADEVEEHYTAPPVIARSVSERAGYPSSFPQLFGAVYGAPDGGDPSPTDLALTSAACHHVFPLIARDGGDQGRCLGVEATCYRGEATAETGRLRCFRMYEVVRYGAPHEVEKWRDHALRAADTWLGDLGLDTGITAANDPFFGRIGSYLASAQRAGQLKWEVVTHVAGDTVQAVASANYHRDHFGEAFELRLSDGSVGHSACAAFGLDRILLALRHRHGADDDRWPEPVRALLGF
ncbi:hypothetical protein [Streptomyces sp. NPDC014734]|uniref:hypothetical protein n=1 Tax=Streptomyces sp. NPDC014734 TaxID=3364886 RepID=UPI0037011CEC